MKVIYGMEGLLLLAAGMEDLKKKEIHVFYIITMAIVAVCGCLYQQELNWYGMLGGVFVGLCMLGISVMSKEQIGKGDGIVIAVLGMLCGVRNTLGMVCLASLFMVILACVLLILKKGDKKTRLPFLPALFLGYLMTLFLGGMV